MIRQLLTIAVTALFLGAPASAQKAGDGIDWVPDLAAAKAKAIEEKKPLFVAFTMRDEPANVEVRKNHFHNKKIVALSKRFVCVDAYQGTAVGDAARLEFMNTGLVSAPQFLFIAPKTDELLLRHVWMLSASQLEEKMERALAFFDPSTAGTSAKAYQDRVTVLLEEASGSNQDKRRAALKTLADHDDPRIMKLLIKLTSAGRTQRLEAIFFMGRKGNAKALPYLHRLVQSRDTETAVYAAVALESIAMVESGPFLKTALKKARGDRLRVNLLRALAATAPDDEDLPKILARSITRGGKQERIAGLWIAAHREKDKTLVKPIQKATGHRDEGVRCAAYVAVGAVPVEEAGKLLQARVKRERGKPLDCCKWALERLGLSQYDGETDPETLVDELLPDGKLRTGDIDDLSENRRGGRGGGGRGGGGRGGGGRGGGRR